MLFHPCTFAPGSSALVALRPAGLLALAVAGTKSSAVSGAMGSKVVEAAVQVLDSWTAHEAIRLLLAVAKAKPSAQAQEVPGPLWAKLLQKAAAIVTPSLRELPPAELIRLALAAKSHAAQEAGQRAVRRGEGSLEDWDPAAVCMEASHIGAGSILRS
eukprot:g22227.t1